MEVVLVIVIVVLLVGAGVGFFLFRRHYQQLLKMAMRRAQKSEQLKAVFIDNACHTLRTPLNAISGYSTMILETPDAMRKTVSNCSASLTSLLNCRSLRASHRPSRSLRSTSPN